MTESDYEFNVRHATVWYERERWNTDIGSAEEWAHWRAAQIASDPTEADTSNTRAFEEYERIVKRDGCACEAGGAVGHADACQNEVTA